MSPWGIGYLEPPSQTPAHKHKHTKSRLYTQENNGVKSDNLEKNLMTRQSKQERFIWKKYRHYNVSVLMNHRQDWEGG